MSQRCENCSAPRTTHYPACPYCKTLYAGETSVNSPIPGLPPEFEVAMRRAELITAIKIYRETFKCDLKTAKESVERIREQYAKR